MNKAVEIAEEAKADDNNETHNSQNEFDIFKETNKDSEQAININFQLKDLESAIVLTEETDESQQSIDWIGPVGESRKVSNSKSIAQSNDEEQSQSSIPVTATNIPMLAQDDQIGETYEYVFRQSGNASKTHAQQVSNKLKPNNLVMGYNSLTTIDVTSENNLEFQNEDKHEVNAKIPTATTGMNIPEERIGIQIESRTQNLNLEINNIEDFKRKTIQAKFPKQNLDNITTLSNKNLIHIICFEIFSFKDIQVLVYKLKFLDFTKWLVISPQTIFLIYQYSVVSPRYDNTRIMKIQTKVRNDIDIKYLLKFFRFYMHVQLQENWIALQVLNLIHYFLYVLSKARDCFSKDLKQTNNRILITFNFLSNFLYASDVGFFLICKQFSLCVEIYEYSLAYRLKFKNLEHKGITIYFIFLYEKTLYLKFSTIFIIDYKKNIIEFTESTIIRISLKVIISWTSLIEIFDIVKCYCLFKIKNNLILAGVNYKKKKIRGQQYHYRKYKATVIKTYFVAEVKSRNNNICWKYWNSNLTCSLKLLQQSQLELHKSLYLSLILSYKSGRGPPAGLIRFQKLQIKFEYIANSILLALKRILKLNLTKLIPQEATKFYFNEIQALLFLLCLNLLTFLKSFLRGLVVLKDFAHIYLIIVIYLILHFNFAYNCLMYMVKYSHLYLCNAVPRVIEECNFFSKREAIFLKENKLSNLVKENNLINFIQNFGIGMLIKNLKQRDY